MRYYIMVTLLSASCIQAMSDEQILQKIYHIDGDKLEQVLTQENSLLQVNNVFGLWNYKSFRNSLEGQKSGEEIYRIYSAYIRHIHANVKPRLNDQWPHHVIERREKLNSYICDCKEMIAATILKAINEPNGHQIFKAGQNKKLIPHKSVLKYK